MMPEEQEISLEVQLEFIEGELRLKEEFAEAFKSDLLREKVERDVVLMKAVRDTLQFECLMEKNSER